MLFTLPQTEVSGPANVSATELVAINIESDTAAQIPLLVDVRIIVTIPVAVSAVLKLYIAVNELSLGVKLPVPLVDHCPVTAPPVTLPLNWAVKDPLQITMLFPAFTIGAVLSVIIIESIDCGQDPLPKELKVSVTVPLVMSFALGLYTAFNTLSLGANIPEPLDVHTPNPEPTVPAN